MFELQKPEITLFCKTLFTEKACADGCTFHYRMLADGESLIRLCHPLWINIGMSLAIAVSILELKSQTIRPLSFFLKLFLVNHQSAVK